MSSGAGAGNAVPGWLAMRGVVDLDDRHLTPVQPVGQPGGGDRGDRRGIGEHEPDPGVGQCGVDRQVGRPGLEHRQHRHDRLGGSLQQQRHTLPRAPTLSGQQVRQPVRGLLQLPIGQGVALEGHRHRRGGAGHLGGDQLRNRHRRWCGLGQHGPVTPRVQAGVLVGIEQIDRRQRPCRVGGDRLHHPPESLDQRLDAGRVEHVGAKLHRPADPGRRTGLTPAFGQRKHQIHRGGAGVGRQRGDLQHHPTPARRRGHCPARAGSARPASPAPAGDGSAIGSG